MTRVQDIIKGARITLNDPNAERWSNEDLLFLINEGQEDIAKQAELFKGTFVIPLEQGKDKYALPEDLIKLQRVVYNNYKLEIVSTRFMDDLGRNSSTYNYTRENQYYTNNWISNARDAWRKDTTDNDVFFAIFDYDAEKELRVYPRPFGDDLTTLWTLSSLYGITDSFDDSDTGDVFGILDEVYDEDEPEVAIDMYGITVNGGDYKALTVRYVKAPEEIESINDDPRIPPVYDTALKYWTTGQALRNDLNVQNRQFGTEELSFYDRELNDIKDLAETDYMSAPHFRCTYRGMG